MKKTDLEQRVAEDAGLNKAEAKRAVDAVFEAISTALAQGDKVDVTGFGSFQVTETKARTGRNPRTGETLNIAAGKRPSFKAGSRLKESVGGR